MAELKTSVPPTRAGTADGKHHFIQQLATAWPPESWTHFPIVLAVSGGPDSVALLHGIKEIRNQYKQLQDFPQNTPAHKETLSDEEKTCGISIIVGHFNHRMRGSEADADADFVQSLCINLGLPYEIGEVDKSSIEKTPREGWESTCRQMRYAFLQKIAEKHGARYVVTGHTVEDQVETILHRVIRGTGLRGLAGMPRSRPLSPAVSLLRPMLTLSRSSARDYLQSLEITWRTDSSNESDAFTRNRLRHELLPMLQQDFNPQVSTAILRLGQLAGEAQEMVDGVVTNAVEDYCPHQDGKEIALKVTKLTTQTDFFIREFMIALWREADWPLQAMGLTEWQSLVELLRQSDAGSRTLPGGVVAKKEGGKLWLHRP